MFDIIGNIFKPLTDLIGKFVADPTKKLEVQSELMGLQSQIQTQLVEYEKSLLEQQSSIIRAEAGSESWLTKNWRPIVMLDFVALLTVYWLGITHPVNLTEPIILKLLSIVEVGLGGYVIGRSAEKIVPQVTALLKSKNG